MHATQTDENFLPLTVATIDHRQTPAFGIDNQGVLKTVDRMNRTTGEADHLVVASHATTVSVAFVQYVANYHVAVFFG